MSRRGWKVGDRGSHSDARPAGDIASEGLSAFAPQKTSRATSINRS